ncbi:MAG: universal stress protein [Halobacteriovoraceae bacterium]|nr:universal stress protein [Halobacteriovoraceae bacterium]
MKNVVLCASLNDPSLDLLETLEDSEFIKDAKVHLIHCFEVQLYTADFAPYIYPTEEKYPEIEEASQVILKPLKDKLEKKSNSIESKVFFSQSPKQKIKEYLKEVDADLVVVATRGKHGIDGLFSSSFAEFLVKFSPCDVHILRPKV